MKTVVSNHWSQSNCVLTRMQYNEVYYTPSTPLVGGHQLHLKPHNLLNPISVPVNLTKYAG